MNKKRTEVAKIGKLGLIEKISKEFKTYHTSTIKGIGDDSAVIDYKNQYGVVSNEILIENIHFDLSYFPLKHLGFKSVTKSIMNVLAMCVIPSQISVNLSISNRFSIESIDELYLGIRDACDNYKIDLIGGDIKPSPQGLNISITALGNSDSKDIVYRSEAKKNDIICVTGDLARSYLGLQILKREKNIFNEMPEMQPELTSYKEILQKHLHPIAPIKVIEDLKKNKISPTSMIDISNGLASELLLLSNNSKVGMNIYENKLPIFNITKNVCKELKLNEIICALHGGDENEILFTVNQKDYQKLKKIDNITIVGYVDILDNGVCLITGLNQKIPITPENWETE